jgi:hypothetical protein
MRFGRHGWVAFAILLLPRLAVACPMCASQQHGGAARIAALGGLLLLPFAIAFVVFGALRGAGGHTASLNGGQSRRRRLWLGLSSFRPRQRPPHPPPERWQQ